MLIRGVWPKNAYARRASGIVRLVHPFSVAALRNIERLLWVVPQLFIVLEGDGIVNFSGLVFDYIEVHNRLLGVQFLDAAKVILVRVGRDEPTDAFARRLNFEFCDNLVIANACQVAVDYREVVAGVANVEHVAVADRKALDDRHWLAFPVVDHPLGDDFVLIAEGKEEQG